MYILQVKDRNYESIKLFCENKKYYHRCNWNYDKRVNEFEFNNKDQYDKTAEFAHRIVKLDSMDEFNYSLQEEE